MSISILIASLLLLSILFIQDLKDRSVSAWIFPLLTFLFIAYAWPAISIDDALLNIAFVAITLITLLIYVRITKGTYQLTAYLGMGDILFWCCLCVLMSPLNYLLFFTGSLVFTLVVMLTYTIITKKHCVSIPLAGIQAALLAVCMLIALWFPQADVRQSWLLLL